VQTVYVLNTTAAGLTATIPWDNTVPQISEGTQIFTGTISPGAVGNQLRIDVDFEYSLPGDGLQAVSALFIGTTANAISARAVYCYGAALYCNNYHYTKIVTASTTGATVFSVRAGPNSAATMSVNGYTGGAWFGGAIYSYLLVTEYKA